MNFQKYKKIISILLILSTIILIFPRPVYAQAWGEAWQSTIWQVTTEKMMTEIKESLVASAKVIAIRIVQGRLNVLLTGSCGQYCIGGTGAMFITDWQDFVFGSAQRTADQVVNDFFNGLRSGTTASMGRVVTNAQKALDAEVELTKRPPDLQNYVSEGKAALIFDPSTPNPWKAWTVAGQPQNDLAYRYLQGWSIKQEAFRQEEERRKTMGVAYSGFTGTQAKSTSSRGPLTATSSQGGKLTIPPGSDYVPPEKISLPGSVVKDITSEVQGMGVKMLEFARSIPEIVSGMIVQTLTNLINYGIKQITDPIDKSIMQTRNQIGTQIWQAQNQIQQGARENIYFNKKK